LKILEEARADDEIALKIFELRAKVVSLGVSSAS
jgi:hypothetical protein